MKTFLSVVLGVGLGVGGLLGCQAYEARVDAEDYEAFLEASPEDVKTFVRCIGGEQ